METEACVLTLGPPGKEMTVDMCEITGQCGCTGICRHTIGRLAEAYPQTHEHN